MTDQTEDTRKLDDDTEGHGPLIVRGATDDDDTEGHGPLIVRGATDDDDTEGHNFGHLK